MIRNLKALGLALVAVFAMSALVASAAQANFTVEGGGSATVKPVTTSEFQKFKTSLGTLKCSTVGGEGTFSNEASEITVHNISYTNCKNVLSVFPVTVDFPSGCHYTFTTAEPTTEAEVHLTCGEGESITITIFPSGDEKHEEAPVCTYHIFGPQTFPIEYHNVTHNEHMAVEVTANEAPVATSHDGSLCGTGSETAHYTGTFVAAGESGGKPVGVTVHS